MYIIEATLDKIMLKFILVFSIDSKSVYQTISFILNLFKVFRLAICFG